MKNSNQKSDSAIVCCVDNSEVVSESSAASEVRDVLSQILREGAQKMLQSAIHKEVEEYLQNRASILGEDGRRLVIRNGSLLERELITRVEAIRLRQPRVRDKRPPEEREVSHSSILPKYLRKTKSIEELVPWLYLKGISANDFPEAIKSLRGKDAKGFSPTTITRLKSVWEHEYGE